MNSENYKSPKKHDKNLYKRLLKYANPYIWQFVLAIAIILIIVALELYQPVLIGNAVDNFLSHYSNNAAAQVDSIIEQQSHVQGVIKISFVYLLTVVLIFS